MNPNDSEPSLENTPLLPRNQDAPEESSKVTPLPWPQLLIAHFIRSCDGFTTESIRPYLKRLVAEMDIVGGDERKVGYYVGLMESIVYAVYAIAVLQWNRYSDRVGRKPIALIGLFGMTLSMLCFGLSRTFWGLVASRCLGRLLDGNTGVTQTIIAEITDSTNRAAAFGFMSVSYQAAASIGPLIGGNLARPSVRFPNLFTGPFWKQYPYFLPCLVASIYVATAFLVTLFFLKESAPGKSRAVHPTTEDPLPLSGKPPPLHELLVYPVLISIANYTVLEFLSINQTAILPLFLALPVELGGLGFDPPRIGNILWAHRVSSSFYFLTCYPSIIHRLGKRNTFITGMVSFLGLWVLMPVINLSAHHHGISTNVWVGIAVMIYFMICVDSAYVSIFTIIAESVPDKRTLGATNGLSQTIVAVVSVLAPAMGPPLLSFSVERELLGGYAVYVVLFLLTCPAVWLALQLPRRSQDTWEEEEEEEEERRR